MLRERRVDTLFITAALFHTVVEKVPHCFADTGQVLIGGERLDPRSIRGWYEANPGTATVLHNVYGPTEATTFALIHPVPRDFDGDEVPIGTAVPGTGLLLRTLDGRTAEPGELAELLLSGTALARGYRNLPEETARGFVELPDADGAARRWYRTGDLVRQDTRGRVTYVGRADRQVKVRGFRIEPGEVEQRIRTLPAVRQAYVCVRRDAAGRNELLAFLVPGDGLDFDVYERHLTTTLPPYMRPHHTHVVAELPLNANGKVDRAALIEAAGAPWRASREAAVRVTDEQRPVLEIAEEILDVRGLRPDDRWIPNGGDSLKALRFRFEIHHRFAVDLPQDLVLRADFAALADAVHAPDVAARPHPPVPPATDEPDALATSEQERLWLLHQRDPEDRSYDVPLAFRIKGHVDTQGLRRAVRTLVERHSALRTRLVPAPDGLRQRTEHPYDPWQPLEGRPGSGGRTQPTASSPTVSTSPIRACSAPPGCGGPTAAFCSSTSTTRPWTAGPSTSSSRTSARPTPVPPYDRNRPSPPRLRALAAGLARDRGLRTAPRRPPRPLRRRDPLGPLPDPGLEQRRRAGLLRTSST